MQNKFYGNMKRYVKRSLALAVATTTVATSLTSTLSFASSKVESIEKVSSYGKYYEPFSLDTNNDGKTETVWSTFTYGEYPQSQVTDEKTINALESLDADEWYALENPYLTYNGNKDQTSAYGYIGNDCYLRMKMDDSNNGDTNEYKGYYTWDDEDTYHYFKFEPITWRVLDVNADGTNALVVADQVLDCQVFNYTMKDKYYNNANRAASYWKYSTLRSFLNSFPAAKNCYKADYSEYGFSYLAFSDEDLENIIPTSIGDNVFCLTNSQLFTKAYGFNSNEERVGHCTDYAKQVGIFGYADTAFWWTQTAGNTNYRAECVDYQGDVHTNGDEVDCDDIGVRPAMNINLSAVDASAFTGYVDTNGVQYSNKVTFVLPGVANAYSLVKASNHKIVLPNNYEQPGYDYTYMAGNKKLELPVTTNKNCTINVSRTAQDDTITVYYNTSWSNAYIYYRVADGKWTSRPGVQMEANSELKGYNYKFVISCKDANSATICFNNGANVWDNNNTKNYQINALGEYAIKNNTITTLSVAATATPVVTEAPTAEPTEVPTATVAPTAVVTTEPTEVPTATPEVTATPVVTEEPISNQVTLYYSSAWTDTYAHFRLDDGEWTSTPGVQMSYSTDRAAYNYVYTFDVADAKNLTVCFNNGANAWDNNNGNNYTLNMSDGAFFGIKDGKIKTLAEDPKENTLTVYYNTGWTNPLIHFQVGQGEWTKAPGLAMEATSEKAGYTHKYVIPMGDAESVTVCFNNGANAWDSNNGKNYKIYTFTSNGVYGISNGVISNLE